MLEDHHNDDYYTYFHGQCEGVIYFYLFFFISNFGFLVHTNYVGAELVQGIVIISILTETEQAQDEEVYRVLVKTRERDLSLLLPKKHVKTSSSKSKSNKQHVSRNLLLCKCHQTYLV